MSARIARGGAAARPRARAAAPRGRQRRGKPAAEGRLVAMLGGWRVVGWLLGGVIAAIALAIASALGLPHLAGVAAGEAIGRAGFAVRRVEIKGLDRMERLPVYAVALDQESMAMPLIDLEGTRARLLRFGWVKEARLSRRLPDTLVVDIVERRPTAIWQHNRRLSLIDAEGKVLEAVRLDAMPDLPLVIGPAANLQAARLDALMAAAPSLRPMLAGATWVGGRRWDVRFQSGELLALPEGDAAARRALTIFARMDQQAQLLGRGYERFDMRDPRRMVTDVSRQPGFVVPDTPPAAAAADPATTI